MTDLQQHAENVSKARTVTEPAVRCESLRGHMELPNVKCENLTCASKRGRAVLKLLHFSLDPD